ncbi:hypothetical protein LMH87_000528 [Akanthomyces muscarius]|uniref:Uncharacterized protein n=1 Tax=Akanthomyces muscarius TaxID=2231603 RepID=A0A9W8QHI1_AKAMU|nr:hypothetical protein LMH87_000528 [Akanthomyces muscarius]KAJ4155273.1 hypothetical protein LMH87_000528 [Akanthomyces muscarius]
MSARSQQFAQFISARCIPVHAPEGCIEILRAWLYAPIFVTDEELARILDIQPSTSASPKLSSSSICYFRSWTMAAWQLQVVIQDLISQGFCNDILPSWTTLLQTCSPNSIVTPRPNSIKGAFIDSLTFFFPEIANSHKIYSIQNTKTLHAVQNKLISKEVAELFESIAEMEPGTTGKGVGQLVRRLKDSIGVNQLYNWPGSNAAQRELSAVLSSWLRLTCPIVSITFGKITSGWVCNGQRTPMAHLLKECGVARIASLDRNILVPTIAIPHIHPGFFVRTHQTEGIQRVVWLSWAITWIYWDSTIKILSTGANGQVDRANICDRVQEHAKGVLEQSGLQYRLQHAKASLETTWAGNRMKRNENWATEANKRLRHTVFESHNEKRQDILDKHDAKRRRLLDKSSCGSDKLVENDDIAPITGSELLNLPVGVEKKPSFSDFEYLTRLERFGHLYGQPHTAERLQQAEQLFGSWLWLHYGKMDKNEWMEFLVEQPNNYYLAACLESTEGPETIPHSKRCWLQDSMLEGKNVTMINDFDSRRCLIQEISEGMMNKQANWLQDSHKRGQKLKAHAPPVNELNGSRIHVNQHGLITIKYLQQMKTATIQIKFGSSITPLNYLDLRTIHFTESGIDIRNNLNQILHGKCSTKVTTIPVDTFPMYGNGREIISIWSEATGLCYPESPRFEVDSPGTINPGQPIPSKLPTKTSIARPSENDALWLLNRFLTENLPGGGEFWTGGRDLYPMRADDAVGTDDFLRFLHLPAHAMHPYASDWSNLLTSSKNCNALRTSLQLLRSTVVRRQNAPRSKVPAGQKTLRCIVYDLGPQSEHN